jgi:hypothetical protein
MDSDTQLNDYFLHATAMQERFFSTEPSSSIDQPGQKRRRGDINDDNGANDVQFVLPNVNNQSSANNMDTDNDPPAAQTQPTIRISLSSTSAADSGPSMTSTMVQMAIKTAIENYVCDTVRRYGTARLELYSRQVALRNLLNHATNNTLPKDLCFNVQTGNPYKKTVPNRDALMAQEQAILHEAKLKILQQRIETAKTEEQRLQDECKKFQDVAFFKARFIEEFPARSLLANINQDDCVALYLFHLEAKTRNMDKYCEHKEAKYAKSVLKKQKTTPLTETVNEKDFQDNLQDVIYQKIMAFAKKYSNEKSDKHAKQASKNSKSSKTTDKTANHVNGSKQQKHSAPKPTPKQMNKPVSKPVVKPATKQPQRQHQPQNQSQQKNRQQSRSYANVVSSSYRDKRNKQPASRVVYEEDGDGWIKVPSKRHVPKNVSSKDPRDVPKRWRK